MISPSCRYKLIEDKLCNITLVMKLRTEDHNTRWRCQVFTRTNSSAVFLDFKSSFYFLNTPSVQKPETSGNKPCPVQLPISRIVLCVVLPLLVSFVGVFTCTLDHRRAKMAAAAFELHQMKWLLITALQCMISQVWLLFVCVFHYFSLTLSPCGSQMI